MDKKTMNDLITKSTEKAFRNAIAASMKGAYEEQAHNEVKRAVNQWFKDHREELVKRVGDELEERIPQMITNLVRTKFNLYIDID